MENGATTAQAGLERRLERLGCKFQYGIYLKTHLKRDKCRPDVAERRGGSDGLSATVLDLFFVFRLCPAHLRRSQILCNRLDSRLSTTVRPGEDCLAQCPLISWPSRLKALTTRPLRRL